jgi:hypothetical protein
MVCWSCLHGQKNRCKLRVRIHEYPFWKHTKTTYSRSHTIWKFLGQKVTWENSEIYLIFRVIYKLILKLEINLKFDDFGNFYCKSFWCLTTEVLLRSYIFQNNIYGYLNLFDSLKLYAIAVRRALNDTNWKSKNIVYDGRYIWDKMRRLTFQGLRWMIDKRCYRRNTSNKF